MPGGHPRHRRPAQRHRLLLLPRRRIPQSQGEGYEARRQPLLPAQELRLRIGRRGHRLPLRGAARGHHGGGDHHVRRIEAQQVAHHQTSRDVRRPPGPLMGDLRAGRRPTGDRGEHEPRAALRPWVDGRRLLRRQEWRVRRGRRAGRRHGAPHPCPHLCRQIVVGGGGRVLVRHRSRLPSHDDNSSRRRAAGREIQPMIRRPDRTRGQRGGPTRGGQPVRRAVYPVKAKPHGGHLRRLAEANKRSEPGWDDDGRGRVYW